MKIDYIRVKSIADIDLSRIPLASIHLHRYIDSDNNRFALRFNKETHKVEIHRLLKKSELENFAKPPKTSPAEEPERDKLFEIKTEAEKEIESHLIGENSDLNIFDADGNITAELPHDDCHTHIRQELKKLQDMKSRLVHIINNLNGSRIYELSGGERQIIPDLNRKLDVEIFQEIERAEKYFREMTLYPRPISYYSGKYEKTRPGILKKIDSSEEQMNRLIKWEMEAIFYTLLEQVKNGILYLLEKINLKNEEQINRMAYNNQQIFRDAKNAALLCYNEITAMIARNDKWIKMDE